MAAVLQPGTRAVSVPISATSAVSGFIYAGDRVDLLLTHVLSGEKNGQHTATETVLRNARVIAMDQRLDFSPGDKPDVGKTATLELTPKQSEIVTLAVKMGEVSLALRSLQDPEEKGDDEDAPAQPGDSFTHDAQVSHLIKPMESAATPTEPPKQVVVLHGGNAVKQNIDGTPVGGDSAAPAKDDKDKPARSSTPFTRTIASEPQ
jgi:pilus assembly protein CpaB